MGLAGKIELVNPSLLPQQVTRGRVPFLELFEPRVEATPKIRQRLRFFLGLQADPKLAVLSASLELRLSTEAQVKLVASLLVGVPFSLTLQSGEILRQPTALSRALLEDDLPAILKLWRED